MCEAVIRTIPKIINYAVVAKYRVSIRTVCQLAVLYCEDDYDKNFMWI